MNPCCSQRLAAVAARLPQKAALVFEGDSITYAGLEKRAALVALALRAYGVRPGDIVPINLPRGAEPVAALLGIWKAGAAASFFGEDGPPERLEYMRSECLAPWILDQAWLAGVPQTPPPESADFLPHEPAPDEVGLVFFTSGSTGRPKGVLLPHRALALSLEAQRGFFEESDVHMSGFPFSFVAMLTDCLAPLAAGATLHIAGDGTRGDVSLLAAYARKNAVTTAGLPPRMAGPFLEAADGLLRFIFTGSERVRRLWSGKTALLNLYGATETAGPVASFRIDRAYDNTPVGRPYPGSRIHIVDEAGRELPPGEVGEICVSGQVAAGYLNRPELSAERFIPNPFAADGGHAVLFRTADLGRVLPDGNLEYAQRKDWMLKVRGFRVEPGEIEAAMLRAAPLTGAVVVGFEDSRGETRLYGCYTATRPVAAESVREGIAAFLPDYMCPPFLEQVESLPVNLNGKVDRENIRPPDPGQYKAAYAEPRTEGEKILCRAFGEILGAGRVGLDDDFVLLGGSSIDAVRLAALARGLGLSAADVLSVRTPRALAAKSAAGAPVSTALPQAANREEWPLTYAERQMLAEQRLRPESVAYNVSMSFALAGALDEGRFEAALTALTARHRVLRSGFVMKSSGEFVRKVAPPAPVRLERLDCAREEVEAKIAERGLPFDPAGPPLYRFTLFRLGADEYVFNMCVHHSVADGLSCVILFSDLSKLYAGESLPPQNADYLDYAVWRNTRAAEEAHEDFFKKMFADGLPENELPCAARRPERMPFADTAARASIAARPLENAAAKLGVTAYTLLLSAAALTMAKYSGSEDVALGLVFNGRGHPDAVGLAGMFVNSLPIRLKPAGDLGLHAFIRETWRVLNEVGARQEAPFERLVPLLAPDRNTSRGALFDLLLNYIEEMPLPKMPGLSAALLPVQMRMQSVDLALNALREGDDLRLVLSYSRELYDEAVICGFLEQFKAILDRLAGGSDMSLSEAAELPENQRRRLLIDFAGEKRDEARGLTVVDMFRARAKDSPESRAITLGGASLSYGELDGLTDRLAASLAAQGLSRGGVLGILARRGFMLAVGPLGAMKAGAAYLPLDPTYPGERLEYMLEDSGAAVLLADPDLLDLVPNFKGRVLSAESGAEWRRAAAPPIPAPPAPADLMVLLYTSGSTGQPKGVMLSHANLANFCAWYARHYGLTASDAVAAYASCGFDASMMDVFPALTHGARVVVVPEEMRLDLPALSDMFAAEGVRLSFLTTQLGRQFAETMPGRGLRALSVGGETLVPLTPPRDYALYNGYGPTECAIFVTAFKVDRLYDRVPLGKPLDNTRLYILDKRGRLAPAGVAGELCVAGRQVGLGYLNRPDLTAEKFVKNPFSDEPDYGRIYRTGDVARLLPDGTLDFVGRRDFQVKIRGFRVELTEIEGRIREYPGLADAAVVAADAPGGGKCAVAYIVAEAPVDIRDLNGFIRETLPPYMVPSATMQLDKIPLNPNGKVDRKKLPPMRLRPEAGEGEIVPPRTETQKLLCDMLTETLGLSAGDLGITTDLLYAGLNSLAAIRFCAGLSARTGKSLGAMEVMRAKTVERIAAVLDAAEKSGGRKYDKRDIYPLTQNQLGLYFACAKAPDSVLYNLPFTVAFAGEVTAERLAAAVRRVIEAHPYVKTHLFMKDGEVCQLRLDDLPVAIALKECGESQWPDIERGLTRPFNLFEGPLFRVEIYQTPERVRAFFDFHHLIFDGASLDIFLRDLARALAGENLEPESFTSFDLALAEKEAEGGESYGAAKDFFDGLFQNWEGVSAIPADFAPEAGPGRPATVTVALEKNGPDFISARPRELGVTAANLFLAASAFAVSRFANTKKVSIATITNGRDGAERQNNLGMLVQTLPIFLDVESDDTAESFLTRTQNRMFETLDHRAYPYTRLVADHSFDPQIMYSFLGGVVEAGRLGDLAEAPRRLALDRAKFPLDITVEERPEAYDIVIEYDSAIFEEETMRTLGECVANIAGRLASPQNRGRALREFSVATPRQREIIAGYMGPPVELPAKSIDKLFEAAAREKPEAPALIAVDGQLTYDELNRRANRVAGALLAKKVEREDRVAFILPRDSRLIAVMLGIVKAGCAYIPVDPNYPRERIGHIISDSGAKYIVTDGPGGFANALDVGELLAHENEANPGLDIEPENLCYIIYTSGSTGKPKGVMLNHRGLVNYVTPGERNIQVIELLARQGRFVSVSTVSFDIFVEDVFMMLANGLCLVFADEEEARNPQKLADLCARGGVNAINTTPSVIMQYMELPAMRRALGQFQVIVLGAEKFPPNLFTRLRGLGRAVIFNSYGPTETTIDCNAKALEGEGVTVGRPEGGVLEQVMDMDGQPLPTGAVGELWIGGAGVARGYLNRPDLTAERFVEFEGARYYKSGDLAKWTRSGEIVILGRNDSQIKLRGLRIELGEIESAVGAYPGITRNVALVRAIHGQEHLAAYYTAEREIAAEDLREHLSRTLAAYMLPTAYLQIPAMPVTPNGKVDTRALPEAKLMARGEYEEAATEAERAYCEIFGQILGLERVGALDNFFNLGGTSLLVTRVIIDAQDRGYEIAYSDVFAAPTPRALGALKDGGREAAGGGEARRAAGDYDYAKIEALLAPSTPANLAALAGRGSLAARPPGNIALTGAAGFLGIHVLREFLREEGGTAWCVLRGGRAGAEKRLKNMLMYYFDDPFDSLFASRIQVIDGDVRDPALFEKLRGLPIDTLINCAANVRHFSAGTDIEDVNVGGAAAAVRFSLEKGCRLIQTSTASVAGLSVDGRPPEDTVLDESMFFFGQDLSNKYVRSKFMAERLVFEAALEGLDAKVMRFGNLMARSADGEFQANFNSNSFLGQLRAYCLIGAVPYEALNAPVEFSPIDFAAGALLKLAAAPDECRVFHPYNNHVVFMSDVAAALIDMGLPIRLCENDVFDAAYSEALRDPRRAQQLSSIIAYEGEHGRRLSWLGSKNEYTTLALARLGLRWPVTTEAYLERFISAMQGLGFFDGMA